MNFQLSAGAARGVWRVWGRQVKKRSQPADIRFNRGQDTQPYPVMSAMMLARCSAIIAAGRLVFARINSGKIDASQT
jgi:hypothetical protein